MTKNNALPPNLPPRILKREAAAEYVGVSPNSFDEMVARGTMPKPRILIGRREGWDRFQIDGCIDALPNKGGNPAVDHGWIK
jgi:predicted DNA-binding transcriptional regulator AlpA